MLDTPGGFGTMGRVVRDPEPAADPQGSANADRAVRPRLRGRLVDFDGLVEEGMIASEDLALFTFADDPEEGWEGMLGHGLEAHTPTAARHLG